MGLVKRTYVDGETVITAENLNAIQDAIIENEEAIEDQGEAIEGKYSKPSGGIPKTDLASAVQTSLGKADTALQSSDIDSTLTVAGKAADAKKTGDEISDVKNTLNHKADVIYDTASGPIASFPDGADGLPVKDLTVGIEPVQDLHGYENPWPAGGGKNLLPMTVAGIKEKNTSGSWSGNTYTVNGATFTIQTDSDENVIGILVNRPSGSTNATFIVGSYTFETSVSYKLNGCPSNGSTSSYYLAAWISASGTTDVGTGATFTPTADETGDIQISIIGSTTVSNILFKPMIRLASETDATFAPYSNICPISGRTGANVYRSGANLLSDVENGSVDSTGNISSAQRIRTKDYIPVSSSGVYQVKATPTTAGKSAQYICMFYNASKTYLNNSTWYNSGNTFTPMTDAAYVRIVFRYSDNSNVTVSNFADLSMNEIDTTIPISWQSEAGKVYGGALDVTSGVLTVDRARKTYDGSENWQQHGSIASWFYLDGNITDAPFDNNKADFAISNGYVQEAYSTVASIPNGKFAIGDFSGTKRLVVKDTRFATVGDFKTALSLQNLEIVYKLAQHTSVTLTPTKITTLLGQNNIFADCGPSTVEYPADTKLYIQKINTPTDDDMIADTNIASGKYFIINNNLYLSTAAILAGDPIKPGTNCTLTNLAAALNALNS